MTKLEAIVQPNRFEQVKDALIELGVDGMTVSEVRGHGSKKGTPRPIEAGSTKPISCRR